MAVDTHIFRVSNRTGLAPGKNVVEVEKKLMKFVPKEFLLDSHHWLILHGRYVCLARKPRCGSCRIEDLCEYRSEEHTSELQSLMRISYAVFCLKKKTHITLGTTNKQKNTVE